MKLVRRQFLHLAAGAAALPTMSRITWAQTYPTRPITVIVPYAAGGGTDVTARLVAQRMRAPLGQPVIVENVTGAGGSIGAGRVARAAPDGYTINLGQIGSHVLPGAMYPLQYDLLNDFEPIALLAIDPLLVLAKSGIAAGDLQGLIAWLKANPDTAAMGHSGFGGMSHVAGVLFQKESGTRFRLVPYRGAAPALQDLAAGHIDLQITDAATSLPGVRAGLVKALAITANARLPSLPNVPTVDEAGLPGFYLSVWYALWAPRGTSKDIISKLNAALAPDIPTYAEMGLPAISSPDWQGCSWCAGSAPAEADRALRSVA